MSNIEDKQEVNETPDNEVQQDVEVIVTGVSVIGTTIPDK
jgi:hypothetical protein